ncbi:hypothetical protein IDM40_11670 [Nocardiopsis sp. HNM0947]|uniref:DUF5709 domain-containing protein n=1 Tax=Nocardiopsis coralli TaxID=2772213 RepID=A0ABR9P6N7_9ACTN|nr:hypothetical protein [Nocardiopsis coralli]MBE2999360.1 hypothetical protein [Nocardiopsis coralli]
MSTHDETGNHQPGAGEDPAEAVPEADSAEQSTDAAPAGEREDWQQRVADTPFTEGSEADVVEQSIDAGSDDEDEHR